MDQSDLKALSNKIPLAEKYIKEYHKRVQKKEPSVTYCERCVVFGHDLDSCPEIQKKAEALALEKHAPNRRGGFFARGPSRHIFDRGPSILSDGAAGLPSISEK